MNQKTQKISKKGFTLVELLVVIAIIAVLATAVTLVLNPAELLRQARDTTRISDLDTIDGAISLFIADVTSSTWVGATSCTFATGTNPFGAGGCQTNSITVASGTGWVPVAFTLISGGSPLSRLPIDPVNNAAYLYAYKSNTSSIGIYEIDANMESTKYSTDGANDKEKTDGGNNDSWYEVGKNLAL